MNLYASVRDENGNIIIIRDSDYKTKKEFKEILSMNGFKIRFVCIDDEDIIDYEAEKYEYKLQKARENAKYKREWLKTNRTELVEKAEPVAEVEKAEPVAEVEKLKSSRIKKLPNDRYFYIKDVECTTTISYTTRKELLWLLDNILNNRYDTFEFMEDEGACFHIMYKDGSEDVIDMFYDGHKIKKINIASIVYTDATENLVYGDFEVSECGSVGASLTEKIDNTNVVEVSREYKFEPLEIGENNKQVELNENTNTIDNNISELTNSVIELDKLNKSNTIVSEKSREFLKEFNALSKDIITNAVDNAIKNTNKALLRIKINNLMCFTYLLTQAICKFLQNCNKVPNSTSGFIRCMKFNFLGTVFNIEVIDGKITYVNFGRLSMIINNRCNYKAYDYVLDCYIYFSNIYYNIGRCIINAYRHIHINSYRKVTTQHILLKQFCGSYAENHS